MAAFDGSIRWQDSMERVMERSMEAFDGGESFFYLIAAGGATDGSIRSSGSMKAFAGTVRGKKLIDIRLKH